MNRWPNQIKAIEETTSALLAGAKRICVTSPTGTGKTTMMIDLIEWAVSQNLPVALYTNRQMLFDQTHEVLVSHGINVGRRAAKHQPAALRPVQLCMTQTVASRSNIPDAKIVIVDELHNQCGDQVKAILQQHYDDGAAMVGYTATPLDIGEMVDELIVAGTVSAGRECGALVPAYTYGPDEPDLGAIKKYRIGDDLSEGDNVKAMMRPGVFSRVYDNWARLNPEWKPTILFAPDVAGSIFFAEEFTRRGVRAAHIDGNKIWLDGELHESDKTMRDELARLHKSAELPVVCNRFVLREGIDWPWAEYGVLACVFGGLTGYLQSCGRLLRSCAGKAAATIQDHGGNWWRHGSVNADREWSLGMTTNEVVSTRLEKMRSKQEQEPIHCPKCAQIRLSGAVCKSCGYSVAAKSRVVVQVDGSLRTYRGDICKPRKVSMQTDTEKLWMQVYWRCRKSKTAKTLNQARGLFFNENKYYPPENLPLMPKNASDWSRRIIDVPMGDLIQRAKAQTA